MTFCRCSNSVKITVQHGVTVRATWACLKLWFGGVTLCTLSLGNPFSLNRDISVAGKQRGITEGERASGSIMRGFRILKETRPKYSIIENVKNLVGKSFRADFESMLDDIESIGYNNYWKVLNAKNYGIPQNREGGFHR